MWDQILSLSDKNGFRIRGIWIADMASQGASGVLNEYDVGDDRTTPPPTNLYVPFKKLTKSQHRGPTTPEISCT